MPVVRRSPDHPAVDVIHAPRIDPDVDRAGHDYRYALDVAKAGEELGWSAEVAFREGMERTVNWYRENESWWRPLRNGEYWEFYRRNYRPQGS